MATLESQRSKARLIDSGDAGGSLAMRELWDSLRDIHFGLGFHGGSLLCFFFFFSSLVSRSICLSLVAYGAITISEIYSGLKVSS